MQGGDLVFLTYLFEGCCGFEIGERDCVGVLTQLGFG